MANAAIVGAIVLVLISATILWASSLNSVNAQPNSPVSDRPDRFVTSHQSVELRSKTRGSPLRRGQSRMSANPPALGSLAYQAVKTHHLFDQQKSEGLNRVGKKQLRAECRVEFLQSCLDANVIPKFLNFSIPANLKNSKFLVRKAQNKSLKQELSKAQCDLRVKKNQPETLLRSLNKSEWIKFASILEHHLLKLRRIIRNAHDKKLQGLISPVAKTPKPKPISVINVRAYLTKSSPKKTLKSSAWVSL